MSKRIQAAVLNRPVEREETTRLRSSNLKGKRLDRPVEPLWSIPATINPTIIKYAPIFSYIKPWFDGRYSRQCLCRMIQRVYEQEMYGVTDGLEEYCDTHAANTLLLKNLLFALVWSAERQVAA